MSDIRYDGRVAVITGAGGGLGKTYAVLLASRGASVVVNDLGGAADGTGGGTSMADQTVKEITEAGGKAVANYDSVATPEGGAAIVQAAVDNFGKVDIVINNAGIVSQPAFRAMKENNYGRFVFTSSGAGIFGNFGQTNYGAAKMGLVGLSNVLAVEGAKNNIKSNVIAPIAKTRLTQDLLGPMADALDPGLVTPLVAYLVSEQCDLTHEIFDVGGGRYARVFVGLGRGWTTKKGQVPSPEEIAANLDAIRDTEGYTIPDSIAGEMQAVAESLKAQQG
jgi:NAD(P)-dependent dehydrogenase (short-subunit alcohol dehydrogenase family)